MGILRNFATIREKGRSLPIFTVEGMTGKRNISVHQKGCAVLLIKEVAQVTSDLPLPPPQGGDGYIRVGRATQIHQ